MLEKEVGDCITGVVQKTSEERAGTENPTKCKYLWNAGWEEAKLAWRLRIQFKLLSSCAVKHVEII